MHQYLLLLICLLLANTVVRAQPGKTKEEFQAYTESLYKKLQPLADAKQYREVLTGLGAWQQSYESLAPTTKSAFTAELPGNFYNQACYYSLLKDRTNALAYFKRAIQSGYKDYNHAKTDSDLAFIRDTKEFQRHLASIREKGDYLYVLKQAQGHAAQTDGTLPAFHYQSAADPQLLALRKTYKLDSIAGAGTDVSRMINLMHWVHNRVPHNGNINNPASRNAQDLLTVCEREKRGLNCRGLATVLNEVYLSMGYKARFIGCLPKDTADFDSHVINAVYSATQNKWLWMDPTHDAYVMDEQGSLLSIEEVRQRLLTDKPLLLNPTANWNYKQSTTKEEYLYSYMAKNLYYLETPISSQYDLETRREGKTIQYIRLLPLAIDAQKQPVKTRKSTSTTLTTYPTNSATTFWQKP